MFHSKALWAVIFCILFLAGWSFHFDMSSRYDTVCKNITVLRFGSDLYTVAHTFNLLRSSAGYIIRPIFRQCDVKEKKSKSEQLAIYQSVPRKLKTSSNFNELIQLQLKYNVKKVGLDYKSLLLISLFIQIAVKCIFSYKKYTLLVMKRYSNRLKRLLELLALDEYSTKEVDELSTKGKELIKNWSISHHKEVNVYPLLSSYSYCLASFRSLLSSDDDERVSFIALSSAGFYCTGQLVKCEGCGQELDIKAMRKEDNPREQRFHANNCRFVNEQDDKDEEVHENNDTSNECCGDAGATVDVMKEIEIHRNSCALEENSCEMSEIGKDLSTAALNSDGTGWIDRSTAIDRSVQIVKDETKEDRSTTDVQIVNDEPEENSLLRQNQKSQLKNEISGASTDEGYFSNAEHIFIDADIVDPESMLLLDNTPVGPGDCPKNPGHYAYFPIQTLKLEQLPSKFRHPDVLKFLKLFGQLTVKVTVHCSSGAQRRKLYDPMCESSVPRVGSGFVYLEQLGDSLLDSSGRLKVGGKDSRKSGTVKNYVKNLVKKTKETLYVQANRHLLFDDGEGISASVEFSLEDLGKKSVKVKNVWTMSTYGDHRCVLECRTADLGFSRMIRQISDEMTELAGRLPQRVKEAMRRKIFIIEHPHGGEKVLSYGDSVCVKYKLLKQATSQKITLQKITNRDIGDLSLSNTRKMLMYAADTCHGSSGAPLITFTRAAPSGPLFLDIWTHNGRNIANGLGCSILKTCTPEDFLPQDQLTSSNDDDDTEDEQSLGNQKVDSPVFKVLQAPSYPAYITFQKRLESYSNWEHHHIHQPRIVATAGFFYAGFSDCIRCFQCGLGLKSWIPGDDVYVQHQKLRATCPFLQSQLKLKGGHRGNAEHEHLAATDRPELSPHDLTAKPREGASDTGRAAQNIPMELLKKEHELLHFQLLCKVCQSAPVKDLFLPCGELCVCSECSKLLTHCPSCEKQIMATVTVYFS